MGGIVYISDSGTEYGIDENSMMTHNGSVLQYRYEGIVDWAHALSLIPPGTNKFLALEMLYTFNRESKLGTRRIPWPEIKNHIDGRIALLFTNDENEEVSLTSALDPSRN